MSRRSICHLLFLLTLAAAWAPAAHACPQPGTVVRDLAVERYYADDTGSVIDEAKLATHRSAVEPVRAYFSTLVKEVDASLRQASPSLEKFRAACALNWLTKWAEGKALLGRIDGKQSEAERRWTLAGSALAYLKVRRQATPEQRTTIEGWLIEVATTAKAAFETEGLKRNNHWYWLGLGLGATALAADSTALWIDARSILENGARDISHEGTLPLELGRGRRALHYHAFAAMPLITLAGLAHARREVLDEETRARLRRLVSFTAANLADPIPIEALAGAQERQLKPGAGWLPLYASMNPDWVLPSDIEMASGHRWLGGNVLLLMRHLAEGRSAAAP